MSKRILLVAMESDVITSVPITLRLAGHRVLTANCGLEGIKKARSLLPDLILVDSTLPDMEGATLVDILGRLPSTAALRTLLLISPQREHTDCQAPKPDGLLAQVALALELCQEPLSLESDNGNPIRAGTWIL